MHSYDQARWELEQPPQPFTEEGLYQGAGLVVEPAVGVVEYEHWLEVVTGDELEDLGDSVGLISEGRMLFDLGLAGDLTG